MAGFIDPASFAVFSTLLINIIGTIIIFFSWLCLRRYRGDKKTLSPRQQREREPDRQRSSFLGNRLSAQRQD